MRFKVLCLAALCCGIMWASQLQQKVEQFVSKASYQNNAKFIQKIFANEKAFYRGSEIDVVKVLSALKSNGLLQLKLTKPSNVSITLRVNAAKQTDKDPSPTFLAYSASNILSSIGYSYFYITGATKQENAITLTYTLNAESNIDPLVMTSHLVKRGYGIVDVHRYSATHWIYDVSLKQSSIVAAKALTKGSNDLVQINGKYWIANNGAGILQITPKEGAEVWYPKILTFDNAMNLVDSIMLTDSKTTYKLEVPSLVCHILITDNYNASTLRSGIAIDYVAK